uniref:Uncharacterized protein n=1 Tax=Chromera velia CCMP2878 TaxID=1169474 RepID=A0A0G4I7T0_9ALVE|eukprot:Cvel_11746.t1-p1 / transcript=Cvel_11746.t1 / gene=Cvel_11746 / organism=Chromera_velia_CCMP2878 / gene_product=Vacuolar cation-transporting ATPase YPK9, putative / transcript_product=Vacuolar cation-transporting ATPase YPK9, putative / location=Cvel_scaffold746:37699-49485(-) / protein_length=1550 / sequence_SO=supercontig / SO=protein_coding / is_pseudo=false
MGRYPTGPNPVCAPPECHPRIHDWSAQPGLLVLYSFWAFFGLFSLAWFVGRWLALVYSRKTRGDPKAEGGRQMSIVGYKDHWVGTSVYFLWVLFSLHWVALYLVIVIDHRWDCQFGGWDNLCFEGQHFITGNTLNNQRAMFTVWMCFLAWLVFLLLSKDQLRNWFRLQGVSLREASHLFIQVKASRPPPSEGPASSVVARVLQFVRRSLPQRFQKSANAALGQGSGIRCTTVVVRPLEFHFEGAGGKGGGNGSEQRGELCPGFLHRFVVFEGSRFLLWAHEGKEGCRRIDVKMPSTCRGLHDLSSGLSDGEAARLKAIEGANEIPFEPESLMTLVAKEFFGGFYIYQLAIYMVWIWYGNIVVAPATGLLIVATGLIKASVVRNNQVTLQRVSKHSSVERVYRGGRWTDVPSEDIMHGDIIHVKEGGWTVPCDIALVRGAAVCNEAALTGEAHPVEKRQVPTDPRVVFDSTAKASAAFQVFAGTTVMETSHLEEMEKEGKGKREGRSESQAESPDCCLDSPPFPSPVLHFSEDNGQVVGGKETRQKPGDEKRTVEGQRETEGSSLTQSLHMHKQRTGEETNGKAGERRLSRAETGDPMREEGEGSEERGETEGRAEEGWGDKTAVGIVVAQGIHTAKGRLVSSILFPEEVKFKFEEDLPLVVLGMVFYGVLVFITSMRLMVLAGSKSSWLDQWALAVTTMSQVITPLLPVVLVAGPLRAAHRLAQRGISCLQPGRTTCAGNVRVMCFDKTGTLTKESLDFLGVVPLSFQGTGRSEAASDKAKSKETDSTRPFCLADEPVLPSLLRDSADIPEKRSVTRKGRQGTPVVSTPFEGGVLQIIVSPATPLSQPSDVSREDKIKISRTTSSSETSAPPVDSHSPTVSSQELLYYATASCHSVGSFQGGLVGSQVEVQMFRNSGWTFSSAALDRHRAVPFRAERNLEGPRWPGSSNAGQLCVLKKFEFDHGRQLMSVVVALPQERGEALYFALAKGSFEALSGASVPESVPADATERAKSLALDGCYVLAMGGRQLSKETVAAILCDDLGREDVEAEFGFLGLLLFRNELKSDSSAAVQQLREGDVRVVIVTGDNAECGNYIARELGLLDRCKQVLLAEVCDGGTVDDVTWSDISPEGEQGLRTWDVLRQEEDLRSGRLELSITGKAFRALLAEKTRVEKERAQTHTPHDTRVDKWDLVTSAFSGTVLDRALFFTRVFARMSPDDKVEVVELFKGRGLTVGMCGDGGNDCGALKAAHVGVALSDAEASVVSPFTDKNKSCAAVVDLLRFGRCALHVSFSCVKYLLLYGLLASVLQLTCRYWGIFIAQLSYFMIDIVAVLFVGYAISLAHPKKRLVPSRPTASLLGAINLWSLFGVFLICFAFFVGALFLMQTWEGFVPWPAELTDSWRFWLLTDNWESTGVYTMMYLQYITGALIFSFGHKYRRALWNQWPLLVVWAVLYGFTVGLLLAPENVLSRAFHLAQEQFNRPNPDNPYWRLYQERGGNPSPAMSVWQRGSLVLLAVGSHLACALWQKSVVEGPIGAAVRKKFPSVRIRFPV